MKPTREDLLGALELRFDSDAGKGVTVRQWLTELLLLLWEKEECFSGKNPWGNSGWTYDLLYALAKAGYIDLGPLDEDGYFSEYTSKQEKAAHAFVVELIKVAMSS